MTVKKRLLVSNILMIAVPVTVAAITGLFCLEAVHISLENNIKPELNTVEEFPESCRKIEFMVEHILQESPNSWKKKFHLFDDIFLEDNISYRITSADRIIAEGGIFPDKTQKLFSAIRQLGNEGLVSDGDHSLYVHTITNVKGTYLLELYGKEGKTTYHAFRTLLIICTVVLILTVIISVWFTDRFLISFVFRRIEKPLDILSNGVSRLSDGDISYRIVYTQNDEFAPVCNGFNVMAAHLKESIESVKQHEASRTELIAGISHDLRTPITSIQAHVEGLIDGIASTPDMQKKYLLTIKQKTEMLEHLISQLFLLSKMELPDFPVHKEICNLADAVHTVLQICRDEYSSETCIIMEQLSSAEVSADRDLLMRICQNIIGNSIKYKKTALVHVNVSVLLKNKSAVLTIADDGPGVPAESLANLFTVFYRCDSSRKNAAEGSGLGLTITAQAAARMGCTITAENNTAGGLSVIIIFPLVLPDAAEKTI